MWLGAILGLCLASVASISACDDEQATSFEARADACVLGEIVVETFDPAASMQLTGGTAAAGEYVEPVGGGPSCRFECACVFAVDPRCSDGSEPIAADPDGELPPPAYPPSITVAAEGATAARCAELAAQDDGEADAACFARCLEPEQPPYYAFENGGAMLCCVTSLWGDDDEDDTTTVGGPWASTTGTGGTSSGGGASATAGTSSSTTGEPTTSSSTGGDGTTGGDTGGISSSTSGS